ncbi:MAG TPA: hypothetical protein VGK88_06705 [bacterium]|jgi:hypothetical protein
MKSTRSWRAFAFPLIVVLVLTPWLLTQFPSVAQGQAGAQVVAGNSATMAAGTRYTPAFSASPQAPSAAQLAASEAQMQLSERAWASRPGPSSPAAVSGPTPGTDTAASRAMAPNTFTLFRNSLVNGAPSGYKSNVNEPAVAQSGKFVWFTHNWYAARSTSGGASGTFAYVSPYADFASFCCDQDTIYDKARDMFIWYRQGVYGTPAGQNYIKISVSINGGASWCTYTIQPTSVNGAWTSQWFDYPHLAVSNNYLYWTSNMFSGAGSFLRMLMARWPLDSMAACAGFGYTYWFKTTGWSWTPVQGATTTMYVGDNSSTTTSFYIGVQPESTTTLTAYARTIPGFTFTNRDAVCTVLGGRNPCLRADQRITVGWVRDAVTGVGQIGFFWNVKAGSGFTYPYVNAATFNQSSLSYTGRPYIYSGSGAWFYAAASPDSRGDLGVSVFFFSSSRYPDWYVGIDDDYNAAPPGWEVAYVATSSGAPGANVWGDYVRVRPFNPPGTLWVATGFTSTGSSNNTTPRLVFFGRGRDLRSFSYWNNK